MNPKPSVAHRIWVVLQYLGAYFLSLVLLLFGISKFFNAQFQIYNYVGYTPLKDLSLMTHAWSFFGRSYNYNLFLGIVEVMAGLLILFPRTRLAGLLMALGVFINVLIIDIEFKVTMALPHVIVECIVLLLLLIPYLGSLKRFFWDIAGRFGDAIRLPGKALSLYLPVAFLVLVSAGAIWEITTALSGDDPIKGSYQLKRWVVNQDTLAKRGGKYTREPMLFFEFGNMVVVSANDSTYWGDYFITKDSINIVLDKEFYGVKSMRAILNRDSGRIQGLTDKGYPVQLQFTRVQPAKK